MIHPIHSFVLQSLTLLLVVASCNNDYQQDKKSSPAKTLTTAGSKSDEEAAWNASMIEPHAKNIDKFKIEYGYKAYNEDKFGFSNPGYMRVFKDNKLVFEDSFEGEGPVNVSSLGYQELAGQKLVFTLNYGTEACDYAGYSRYYVSIDDKIYFLHSYRSFTGGDQYASRFYEHIFPNDSAGVPNTMLMVEGIIFHEHDQPNRFDTTYIQFTDNTFNISKATNNLDSAK